MGETEAYRVNFGSSLIDFLPFLLWSICPPSPISSIDCAGILKLRNSDIELRKGETDIGRKNTRVRLVFRVHIPQPSGKVLSLQTASIPVECCKIALTFFFFTAFILLFSACVNSSVILTIFIGRIICKNCVWRAQLPKVNGTCQVEAWRFRGKPRVWALTLVQSHSSFSSACVWAEATDTSQWKYSF